MENSPAPIFPFTEIATNELNALMIVTMSNTLSTACAFIPPTTPDGQMVLPPFHRRGN